jgi:SAM-dependent methyltransferase
MAAPPAFSYDHVPYRYAPVTESHPDRLGALGLLFGIETAPVARCRVLDLGCGNGANLIPMAARLPESRFVGIDLAAAPIVEAREIARALGLGNITFQQLDIAEVDFGLGEFDFILSSGVYSWVPPPVRDKLMEVSARHLAPHGLAFINYNTFPGCHLRRMLDEILRYHTRAIADPALKIAEARAFIEFLSVDPRKAAMKEELEALKKRTDSGLFHDDLAEVNDPVYFHEFVEHAGAHGLQFVAEAEFPSMQEGGFSAAVTGPLHDIADGDRIRLQQYLDFLKCRRFRQSVLCHAGLPLSPEPLPDAVPRLWMASPAAPVSAAPDLSPGVEEKFATKTGVEMATTLPLVKAAMSYLARIWPARAPFAAVLEATGEPDAELLSRFLLRGFASGLVELHAPAPPFTSEVSERPRVFAVARFQAAAGGPITNLRHDSLACEDPLTRRLIALLDGARDHAAILAGLQASLEPGQRLPSPADIERNLALLAGLALLES